MRVPCCLLLTVSFILFLFSAKSQTWQPLGPNDFTEASLWRSSNSAIAVYGTTPYMVYRNDFDGRISVRKFNGNAWEFVGPEGIATSNGALSITTDARGAPYIAYGDFYNSYKVCVKKYDGSNWVDVGTPAALTGATSSNCALSITSDGTIYIAFPDNTIGNKLGVRVKYAGGDWLDLTPGGASTASVFAVSIDFDGSGNPYIAFSDNSAAGAVTVMKYTGSGFAVVGTKGISNGASNYTSIAVDATGMPYAVFAEFGNSKRVAVKKFDGTNWVYVGATGLSTGLASSLMIKIDGSGNKYLVFKDNGNIGKTMVKTFDGAAWVNVGNDISIGGDDYPGIALNTAGVPYIVYTSSYYNSKAIVKKLTGNTWTGIGTQSITNGAARLPWMATNSTGVPYIIYYDQNNGSNVVVKEYNGNNWVDVGAALPANLTESPYIAIDANDVPYIFYVDENREAVVRKFDGNNWIAVGTPAPLPLNSGPFYYFAVSANGIPYLAYIETFSGMMNVKKVDGGSWVSVGPADFSLGLAGDVSMTVDASGTPYVIYNDDALSNTATVKKFDGGNWVTVGTLSNSTGMAINCNIVIDGNGTPYAGYNDNGVVIKKFDGSNWVDVGALASGETLIKLAVDANNVPYVVYNTGLSYGPIAVKRFDGSNWIEVGTSGIKTTPNSVSTLVFGANNVLVVYLNGGVYVKSFGPLAPLPLQLTVFNCRIENANGLLNWQTANEVNTQKFIVERSTDGRSYITAGTVQAVNESGVHSYAFTDKNVDQFGASVIYYRLKQVDIDGKATYSRVLMLPVGKTANRVTCYPNPVASETNLTITLDKAEPIQARIIDNMGNVQQVQHWNLGAGATSVSMDMSQLGKGIYYLEISSKSVKKQISLIKL